MPIALTSRFREALGRICEIHSAQRRKLHGEPYVSHLLRVGGMVLEWAEDEDTVLAALLHDAAEDQGGEAMLAEISADFGEHTALLVRQCSDSLTPKGEENKAPWRERKEKYIVQVANAEPGAKLIALCDKIDNARSILSELSIKGSDLYQQFHGGREIHWYFRSMLEALEDGPPVLVAELRRIVEGLDELGARV
ncbi:MAG: HD domain-containing protein [Planctomycetia bacterium]|nr:HD domain-containing protein [Planctomycetia bacterium]